MAKREPLQPEITEDGLVFGENDLKKEHPFKPEWLSRVVVRQSVVETFSSGHKAEDPSTVRVKPYEIESFNALMKNEGFGALKIIVLHDPR